MPVNPHACDPNGGHRDAKRQDDFPMTALAPGAAVELARRPRDGDPIVHTFSETERATLK